MQGEGAMGEIIDDGILCHWALIQCTMPRLAPGRNSQHHCMPSQPLVFKAEELDLKEVYWLSDIQQLSAWDRNGS